MNVPEVIARCAERPELRFLVIGAYAMGAHRYSRATKDLDLLTSKAQVAVWIRLAEQLGYTLVHRHESFVQFAPAPGGVPLDVMLVNPETFDHMFATSQAHSFGGSMARVPSLEHLLALKLHVARQDVRHRIVKDVDDIICLIHANSVDLADEKWRQWFEKYGTVDLYEKVARATAPDRS